MLKVKFIRRFLDWFFFGIIFMILYLTFIAFPWIEIPIKWVVFGLNVIPYISVAILLALFHTLAIFYFWKHSKFIELYLKVNPEDNEARLTLATIFSNKLNEKNDQIQEINIALQELIDLENKLFEETEGEISEGNGQPEKLSEIQRVHEKAEILSAQSDILFAETDQLGSKIDKLIGELKESTDDRKLELLEENN